MKLKFPAFLVACLFGMLAFSGCQFGSAPGGGGTEGQGVKLSGRLVTETGSPLAGAKIRINLVDTSTRLSKSARKSADSTAFLPKTDSVFSNAQGRFEFKDVDKGTYDLIVTSKRDDTLLSLFLRNLVLNENTDLGTDTVPVSGTVTFVVRAAGGATVVGAKCQVDGTPWSDNTNAQGVCEIEGVARGNVRITVTHPTLPQGKSGTLIVYSGTETDGGSIIMNGAEPIDSTGTGAPHFALLPSTVALWTFDAYESGMIRDQKGGFHLTPTSESGLPLAASPFGSAVVMDGTAKRFSVPYHKNLNIGGTGKLTYEARIFMSQYPATTNFKSRTNLVGLYAGIALQILSDGSICMKAQKLNGSSAFWYDTLKTAPGIVPLNQWVDVALAVDTTVLPRQAYAYVNGTPVQLYGTATNNSFRIYEAPFTIGGDSQDGQYFNGKIDEVRVSNSLVLGAGLPVIPKPTTPIPPADTAGAGTNPVPLAHFGFNEGLGATASATGKVTLGAASVNGAQWSPGVTGSSLQFNGTSDYVVLQDARALTGMSKLTVESWVKLTEYGGPYQRIAAVWSGSVAAWTLTVHTDGYFGIEVYAGSSANEDKDSRSSLKVPLNEWAHLAGVYSGDSIVLYMNGARVYARPSIKRVLPSIQQRLEVGCILSSAGSPTFSWPGSIDELKVYDTVLTDAQVRRNYLVTKP